MTPYEILRALEGQDPEANIVLKHGEQQYQIHSYSPVLAPGEQEKLFGMGTDDREPDYVPALFLEAQGKPCTFKKLVATMKALHKLEHILYFITPEEQYLTFDKVENGVVFVS
jgi:hypothetical protein